MLAPRAQQQNQISGMQWKCHYRKWHRVFDFTSKHDRTEWVSLCSWKLIRGSADGRLLVGWSRYRRTLYVSRLWTQKMRNLRVGLYIRVDVEAKTRQEWWPRACGKGGIESWDRTNTQSTFKRHGNCQRRTCPFTWLSPRKWDKVFLELLAGLHTHIASTTRKWISFIWSKNA